MRTCGWCNKEFPENSIAQRKPAAGAFLCNGCCGTAPYQALMAEFYKNHDIYGMPLKVEPPKPTISEGLRKAWRDKNLCENCGALQAVLINGQRMCTGVQPEDLGFAAVKEALDVREQFRKYLEETNREATNAMQTILKAREKRWKELSELVTLQYGAKTMVDIVTSVLW